MHLFIRFGLLPLLTTTLVLSFSTDGHAQENKKKQKPVFVQIEDDPDLPRVLIIGDSISMGYTLDTRAMLRGKANVHRPPMNCGDTQRGLDRIDRWLGEGQWDVIHFNFGLHDLKYTNGDRQMVAPDEGKQNIPVEQYAENLGELVERLKKTGATLIWRNTTPVPEGVTGRVAGDSLRYNQAAAKVMAKHEIPIHDLYTFAKKHEKEIQRPANVHYTHEGSKKLAEQVVDVITQALEK